MNDITGGNPDQVIRLFFSLDLANATAFKYDHPPTNAVLDDADAWPSIFLEFFERAKAKFMENIRQSWGSFSHEISHVNLWKTLGDEVLFYSEQTRLTQPYWQIRAFVQTVHELDESYQRQYRHSLGVKGLVWSAGFPYRNKRYYLDDTTTPSVYQGNELEIEQRTGMVTGINPSHGAVSEFVGLEMDQGFRLGQFGFPGRVICSPDACYLASKAFQYIDADKGSHLQRSSGYYGPVADTPEFRAHLVGWRRLKGVLKEKPVPLVWPEFVRPDVDVQGKRYVRFLYDTEDSPLVYAYQNSEVLSCSEYVAFFERWNSDLVTAGVDHIKPYIFADKTIDKSHQSAWLNTNPRGNSR